MTTPPRPPEQLDVPLVWDLEPEPAGVAREDDPFPVPSLPSPVGAGRLLAAGVLDLGVLLAAVGLAWAVAAVRGVSLLPLQLVFAGVPGVEAASVLAVGCLVAWRGTPGLLLVSAQFTDTLTLSRAVWLWLAWAASLAVLGLPLVVGRAGRRGLELLAGGVATLRSPHEAV